MAKSKSLLVGWGVVYETRLRLFLREDVYQINYGILI